MATSIFFNGKRIVRPGAYSKIDASALQSVGPSATGIVGLIGTAEGGVPLSVDPQFDLTSPDQARNQYRSGDLKTACLFAFDPSQDEAIQGGPNLIVPVKVNPSTGSTITLADANSINASVVTSKDSGQFTSQISIDIENGTNLGKLITITFEDTVETFDDVGGTPIFDVLYTPSTGGFTTALGRIQSSGFSVAATKAATGLSAQRAADIPAPGTIQVVSGSAGDTTQKITVYGLSGTAPVKEQLTLNGTTPVIGVQSFSKVLGAVLTAAAAGTVLVKDNVIPTTLFSLAPAVLTRGVILATNSPVAGGHLTVSVDTNAAVDCAIWGADPTGAVVAERYDLTNAASVPVVGTASFSRIDVYALGDVAGARTVTASFTSISASSSVFKTVQRVVDLINTQAGYTANADTSQAATFLITDADYAAAITLLSTANFYANLFAFDDILTQQSQFVNAARATGGLLVPANTGGPLFLSGGTEGVTTITQWQQAFSLLKKRRVTTIVPLSNDPAIHALLLAHLLLRAGVLRSEANGYAGIGTNGGAGETLTNIKAQILALNSRYVSAISQEAKRFDPESGVATWYPPYIFAAIAAGMQAGAGVGEPLTHKIINALDIRQSSTWNPEDDGDALIDAGLMFAESVDNKGRRWVRSITTHLADNNAVFTEMSAMESANTAVFRLRDTLELKIGAKGLASSVGVIKGLAKDELDRMVDDQIIVAYKPKTLKVEQIGDVFPVSVELSPIEPINFIPITVHLVPFSAAA